MITPCYCHNASKFLVSSSNFLFSNMLAKLISTHCLNSVVFIIHHCSSDLNIKIYLDIHSVYILVYLKKNGIVYLLIKESTTHVILKRSVGFSLNLIYRITVLMVNSDDPWTYCCRHCLFNLNQLSSFMLLSIKQKTCLF